eukprot:SAG31_NODE_974_length_10627_cov_11.246201_4_plen_380_part_00
MSELQGSPSSRGKNERKQKGVTYHDETGKTQCAAAQPAMVAAVAAAQSAVAKFSHFSLSDGRCPYVALFEHLSSQQRPPHGARAGGSSGCGIATAEVADWSAHYAAELAMIPRLASSGAGEPSRKKFDFEESVAAGLLFIKPTKVFDRGNWKEQKVCCGCCHPFTWRKKWERCWPTIYTCSDKCKGQFRQAVAAAMASDRQYTHGTAAVVDRRMLPTSAERVETQAGRAGAQYSYPTGNIWSHAHRGDLRAVKNLVCTGRADGTRGTSGSAVACDKDKGTAGVPEGCSHLSIPAALRNKVGWTPLHAAAAGGHQNVVDFLTSKLVFSIMREVQEGRRASKTAWFSFPDGAYQVNVNATDNGGRTPLFEAARNGHLQVCR